MRTALFITLLVVSPWLLHSQSLVNRVVASGGAFSESPAFMISYTIGDFIAYPFQNQSALISSGFQQNWDLTVGVNDITGELMVVAFPNPVADKLRIKFGSIEYPSLQIEILSLSGNRLFSETVYAPLSEELREYDISNLNSGVYILRIYSSERGSIKTIKLIKR